MLISNKILGITGSIATGKSTVAAMFAQLGSAIVSADKVARDVLAPGSDSTRALIAEFGESIKSEGEVNTIDRAKLGALIYADHSARIRLGEIMHPPIHAILSSQIDQARIDPHFQLVCAEIPLLFENSLEFFVDKILVVSCSESTQIERILQRYPSLSEPDAIKRIQSQLPLCEKVEKSDFVIDTDQPRENVESDAAKIFDLLSRR